MSALTGSQRNAILMDVHRSIEEAADEAATAIAGGHVPEAITYPADGGLTAGEAAAVSEIRLSTEAKNGVRKIIANAAAHPLWTLFALLDGIRDPDEHDEEYWPPFEIRPAADSEVLTERWLEGFDLWRERRPPRDWTLELEGEPA